MTASRTPRHTLHHALRRTATTALLATLAVASGMAAAAPVTYAIDNSHTLPRFEYNHLGLSHQVSRFNTVTGHIVFDAEARTGSVDVIIDAKSVDTGHKLFNEHIQGEDFFDTANHPTITFKSTSVKFEGDKPVAVEGNLTIKGVTRPVTLTLTTFVNTKHPMRKRDAIGANATATIKRSDFNMGKYAPAVSDEVTLSIPVEAVVQ